ncbi:MAG: hypothetical protein AAF349_16675 [Cyanobacteria bacterium P01_A01_bin.68]
MSDKNKKSCILTDTGRKKLEDALMQKYPDGKYVISQIANDARIDRNVVSKILKPAGLKSVDCSKPLTFSKLDDLFSSLNIDLEDNDFRQADKKPKSFPQKQPEIPAKNDNFLSQSNTEKLIDALRELNYLEQESSFIKSVIELKPAGAFLIHGKEGYGQRWIAHRLSCKVPNFTDAFYISLCFKRHRRDIQSFWRNLALEVGSRSALPQHIVEAVYEHWQTQTVMLCFRDVDLVAGEYLNRLLEQFWLPLIVKVLKQVSRNETDDEHPLLLFLIDNFGCKEKLGITCMSQFDCNQPANPVEINELSLFNEREIKRWVRTQKQLFTTQVSNPTNINTIISDIIERNSKPEKALQAICSWCNLDWYEDIQRQLKL